MFAKKAIRGSILLSLVCSTHAVLAQNSIGGGPDQFYRPVPPLPPELGFSYHHASTVLEGALRGQGQAIHATGNYWLSLSQAMINREQARKLALEYRTNLVALNVEMRNWREADRRYRIAERRVANVAGRPARYEVYRLTPAQIDRSTGEIAWPDVLRSADYDELRRRLDELFCHAACGDEPVSGDVAEVVQLVRKLANKVGLDRGRMTSVQYLAAGKFLCGVKHEAEFPLVRPESKFNLMTTRTTLQSGSIR